MCKQVKVSLGVWQSWYQVGHPLQCLFFLQLGGFGSPPKGSSASPQLPEQTLMLKAASPSAPQHHVQAVTHQGHQINASPTGLFLHSALLTPPPTTFHLALGSAEVGARGDEVLGSLPTSCRGTGAGQKCSARNGPSHVSAHFCTSLQPVATFPMCIRHEPSPCAPHSPSSSI